MEHNIYVGTKFIIIFRNMNFLPRIIVLYRSNVDSRDELNEFSHRMKVPLAKSSAKGTPAVVKKAFLASLGKHLETSVHIKAIRKTLGLGERKPLGKFLKDAGDIVAKLVAINSILNPDVPAVNMPPADDEPAVNMPPADDEPAVNMPPADDVPTEPVVDNNQPTGSVGHSEEPEIRFNQAPSNDYQLSPSELLPEPLSVNPVRLPLPPPCPILEALKSSSAPIPEFKVLKGLTIKEIRELLPGHGPTSHNTKKSLIVELLSLKLREVMGKFTNFQAAAAEIGIPHATNMTILLSATNPGVQGDVDTILIKRINQLRQLDSEHGVPLLVGATTTDENGTLLTPFGEILQRNDLLMPSYQELLDLPTEELLAALPADNPAASQDNHHLLPKILMKVVNHLVSILPLQAIVTAFNLSPDYTKLNFCNVTLNASNIISTRHTLVDRINILRKAWCDTRTPPLRAPIPTVCAPSIRPIQSLNQVYTHQQMKVMISELVNDKDFPFIDVPELLLQLGVPTVHRNYERSVEQLKNTLLLGDGFHAKLQSIRSRMAQQKSIIFSKAHRLHYHAKPFDVTRVLKQLKAVLNLPLLSGPHREQLRTILLHHADNVEVARILARQKYPFADIDGGFATVHNQAEVERNQARMIEIHTQRLHTKSYTVDDNPFLDGARAWDEALSNFQFPPNPCSACQEQGLGMVLTNGKCNPCQKPRRALKFGPNNSMDPRPLPDCMKGLTPVETAAISLVSCVMSIHRVNCTPHMKGSTISFPNDIVGLSRTLPRTPAELDIVSIVAPGQSNRLLHVRRDRIFQALTWLKVHNHLYKDITISQENLRNYAEDGIFEHIPSIVVEPQPFQMNQGPETMGEDEGGEDGPSTHHSMVLGNLIPGERETSIILNALRERANPAPAPAAFGTDANPLPWPDQGEPIRDSTPGFFTMAFPHLFPYGKGDITQARNTFVSPQEWISHLLDYKCRRFSEDHKFLFYVFHYMQKRRTFIAGNLYASRDLANMTREEFLELINGSDMEAADLARRIIRKGAGILGSPASMRKHGQSATNLINFLRHHTEDMENLNYFLTLTSADAHCTGFFRLFPEGVAHLAKIKVKTTDLIPEGADKNKYTTESEDFLFRRDFLNRHARHYDVYFRNKVELYVDHMFVQKLGCLDFVIRYEFQARSAIHAHILLAFPIGISRADRLNAIRPWHQDDVLEQAISLVDHPAAPVTEALKAVRTRQRLVDVATLHWGLTECHPSNFLGDRLPVHLGTMMQNPTNAVLRSSLTERLSDPIPSLINLVNKVGIHQCRTSYCLKPKKTPSPRPLPSIPEETEAPTLQCRFDFPQDLLGFQYTGPSDAPTGVQPEDPPIRGVLNRISNPASTFHNQLRMRLARNHPNTVSHNQDTTLTWQANTCSMQVFLEDDMKDYVSKYTSKPEEISPMQLTLEAEILSHPGDSPFNTLCQKVLLKNQQARDYALNEVCLHLNNASVMKFSREMVHISVLEDTALLDLEAGNDQPIGKESQGMIFSKRFSDPNFLAFCEVYAAADNGYNPCPKAPAELTLYDFMSMFNLKWEPLLRFRVVCPHPFFESLPNATSNPDWFRKCLLTTLRLHDPHTPSLDDLQLLSNEELHASTMHLIQTNALPTWVGDMILNERVPPRSYIPTAEEDNVPDNVRGDDQDPLAGLAHRLDEDPLEEGARGVDDSVFGPEDVQPGYDKQADFLVFTPTWTASTPDQCRHAVHNTGLDDLTLVEPALPRDQLNAQQAEGLAYLLFEFQKVLVQPGYQFLAEICGGAGTGKTTLVKCLKADIASTLLSPSSPAIGEVLRFAAPTGCAAKLLPTPNSTLHSLLHLPVTKVLRLEPLTETALKSRQEELQHLKLLVIDEKSFIGARTLSHINGRMQQIFCNPNQPFGGVSVLLMGDFKQLAPVMDNPLYVKPRRSTNSVQVDGLKCFRAFDRTINLTQLQRQASDLEFKVFLDQFVRGVVDQEGYNILTKRFVDNLSVDEQVHFTSSATLLCAVKADYAAFNREKILACGTPRIFIVSQNEPDSVVSLDSSGAGGLPSNLVLCRGMRVMLTANLCLSQGLTNGTMGTVVAIIFISAEDPFPTVLVQFDGFTGVSCLPDQPGIYPVGVITRSWVVRHKTQSRTMLPLQPGYALSIHKSQGQTLENILIDLGSSEFSPGLTYTALTRVRSLSNLALRKMPLIQRFQTIAKSSHFISMKMEEASKLAMEETRKRQYQRELEINEVIQAFTDAEEMDVE